MKEWSHMMTLSNGNILRVTGPLCGEFTGPGEFPAQRPVTWSFYVFIDLRLNKRLSKQPWGWWFETPPWSWWRQWNDYWKTVPMNISAYTDFYTTAQGSIGFGLFLIRLPRYLWENPEGHAEITLMNPRKIMLLVNENQPNLFRADSRPAPSQREKVLLYKDVSHWLGGSPESTLLCVFIGCTV